MNDTYKVLPDGRRRYKSGKTYTPVPPELRKYKGRPHPDAVYHNSKWFMPLEVLPMEQRADLPPTREDREVLEHMDISLLCACDVCSRPAEALEFWRRKWRRSKGLTP